MENNQQETTVGSQTPVADALRLLQLHFVTLGRTVEANMRLSVALAFPAEWMVYDTASVQVYSVQAAGDGCIVTLVGVSEEVPADELLSHASAMILKNQTIEARRQEIARLQEETKMRLQEEINSIMVDTGAVRLADKTPRPPVGPSAQPRITLAEPEVRRPQASPLLVGRPDVAYTPPADMALSSGDVAPSVEELMAQGRR